MEFRMNYPDDETVEFFVNDRYVGMANHDSDGWAGMHTAKELFKNVAITFGQKVAETEHPPVD